jgi:hypothetical protein
MIGMESQLTPVEFVDLLCVAAGRVEGKYFQLPR